MNDRVHITRRAFAGGALFLGLGRSGARAQGFAGLGENGEGFAPVVPGKIFSFPADHGPHPDYRIESEETTDAEWESLPNILARP